MIVVFKITMKTPSTIPRLYDKIALLQELIDIERKQAISRAVVNESEKVERYVPCFMRPAA